MYDEMPYRENVQKRLKHGRAYSERSRLGDCRCWLISCITAVKFHARTVATPTGDALTSERDFFTGLGIQALDSGCISSFFFFWRIIRADARHEREYYPRRKARPRLF